LFQRVPVLEDIQLIAVQGCDDACREGDWDRGQPDSAVSKISHTIFMAENCIPSKHCYKKINFLAQCLAKCRVTGDVQLRTEVSFKNRSVLV
jgi:hypothetical protein